MFCWYCWIAYCFRLRLASKQSFNMTNENRNEKMKNFQQIEGFFQVLALI